MAPIRELHGAATRTAYSGASYIWLLYLFFLVIDPLIRPSWRIWLETLTAVAIFLPLYILYVHRPRLRVAAVCSMLALAVVLLPFNYGAVTFCVYVTALAPFCIESIQTARALLLGTIVVYAAEGYALHINRFELMAYCILLFVIGTTNLAVAQQKKADCALRQAQEENITLAAVAERERIARDLHDVLGHTLSVIVLKAELAGRLLPVDTARAAQELAELESTARSALAEVREAIGGYRARGLPAEVDLARRTLAAASVDLQCGTPIPTSLPPAHETVLALALREAVTNIVRHAPTANRCTLRFTCTPEGATLLEVQDNASDTPQTLQEGNGLRGMRERAESLGGHVSIHTAPHTCLRLQLPAASPAAPVW